MLINSEVLGNGTAPTSPAQLRVSPTFSLIGNVQVYNKHLQ